MHFPVALEVKGEGAKLSFGDKCVPKCNFGTRGGEMAFGETSGGKLLRDARFESVTMLS
jgi:hypothetical protein